PRSLARPPRRSLPRTSHARYWAPPQPSGWTLLGCCVKENVHSVYGNNMRPGQFSRTAEYMALFRAIESTQPEGRRLFNDPFAVIFVGTALQSVVRWSATPILGPTLRGIIDRCWPGARSSGVARTRLIDDWIGVSIANGSDQLVILGAGFDSRAW